MKARTLPKNLPFRYIQLGETVTLGGRTYECVERDAFSCAPKDVCKGCDLNDEENDVCMGTNIECSKFDRRDGKNVKFIKIANYD